METICKTAGTKVDKRQAEELTQCLVRDFDAFHERRKYLSSDNEETKSVLAITVDSKRVVLHEKDLKESTWESC